MANTVVPIRAAFTRILIRALITSGLALLGWLFAAALSTPASADVGTDDTTAVLDSASETATGTGGLLGAVGGLTGGTVGTVTETTTDTVATTVDTLDTTVQTTVDIVDTTVGTTLETVTNTVSTVGNTAGGALTDTDPGAPPASQPSAPAVDPAADVRAPAAAARDEAKPAGTPVAKSPRAIELSAADLVPAAAGNAPPPDDGVQASSSSKQQRPGAPLAPPSGPAGAPSAQAQTGYDHGGHKHLATLESTTTDTHLRLIGTKACHPVVNPGREAALPCVSPD
ncbi:MAG: hypothetical protein ACRDQ7_11460 [Haloechinothrix sp.]